MKRVIMDKFKVGDGVRRELITMTGQRAIRVGIVSKRYSEPERKTGSGPVLGPYEELYEVVWNDGTTEKGFLPHGLDKT